MGLEQELKQLIERLSPDLRAHMRLSLSGVVTKVHEDDYRVDVEVAGYDGEVLSLPYIPVKSPMSMDGWGIFALPELDSEVTVAFWGGDPTNPFVDGSLLLDNRTPVGARAGMIVITDRSGQCIKLKPQTGEIVINGYNIKTTAAGGEARTVDGCLAETINGSQTTTVGRDSTLIVKGKRREVFEGAIEREYKQPVSDKLPNRSLDIEGQDVLSVDGMQDVTVGSDRKSKVLGADYEAVAKSKQVLVGGNLDIMVANAMDSPMPAAVQIGSPPPQVNCWGGKFVPGTAAPMVNGTLLAQAFQTFVMGLLALPNIGQAGEDSVVPSPAFLGLFQALASAVLAALSQRQFFAVP